MVRYIALYVIQKWTTSPCFNVPYRKPISTSSSRLLSQVLAGTAYDHHCMTSSHSPQNIHICLDCSWRPACGILGSNCSAFQDRGGIEAPVECINTRIVWLILRCPYLIDASVSVFTVLDNRVVRLGDCQDLSREESGEKECNLHGLGIDNGWKNELM